MRKWRRARVQEVKPRTQVEKMERDASEREATSDHTGLIRKYLELADRAFGGKGTRGSDDEPTPSAA